jgi:hypothetical protein
LRKSVADSWHGLLALKNSTCKVRSKKEIRSEVGYSSQKEKEKLNKKKNIDNKKPQQQQTN